MSSKAFTKIILLSAMFISFINSVAQAPSFQWANAWKVKAWYGGGKSEDVTTDSQGNVYTVGYYWGKMDLDPGPGADTNIAMTACNDAFILKQSPSGTLIWSRSIKGQAWNSGAQYMNIAIDANDNIFIAGCYKGTVDFDPSANNTYTMTWSGNSTFNDLDIFIEKLDPNGNFLWAKDLGEAEQFEMIRGIDTDPAGNVIATGYFADTLDADPSASTYNLFGNGSQDVFVLKLDAAGNFAWARSIGSDSTDIGYSVATDASGNIFVTGEYQKTCDFDPGSGTYNLNGSIHTSAFVLKLDPGGNFAWARAMTAMPSTSLNTVSSKDIALDAAGNIYTSGGFCGAIDFDPGPLTYSLFSVQNTGYTAYVNKLDNAGNFLWAKAFTGTGCSESGNIALDQSNNVYLTGSFYGTVDFDPGPMTYTLSSNGISFDNFIAKLDWAGNYSWIGVMASNAHDEAIEIAISNSGGIYTIGNFQGTVDADPGTGVFMLNYTSGYPYVFYVHKLNACSAPPEATNLTPTSNLNICHGNSTTLFASGAGSLNWYSSPTSTQSIGSGTVFNTPLLTPGIYTYYVEAQTCTVSSQRNPITVVVNADPIIGIANSNNIICAGQTATLTATGANSYTWNPGGITNSIVILPNANVTFTIEGTDNVGCYGTNVITQSVAICTGLSLNSINDYFNVYPNPTNGKFNIECTADSEIEIMNSLGQIIYRTLTAEKLTTVDQKDLQPGIYIICIKKDQQTTKKKLLIQ